MDIDLHIQPGESLALVGEQLETKLAAGEKVDHDALVRSGSESAGEAESSPIPAFAQMRVRKTRVARRLLPGNADRRDEHR